MPRDFQVKNSGHTFQVRHKKGDKLHNVSSRRLQHKPLGRVRSSSEAA